MADDDVTEADIDELVQLVTESTSAFISGDVRRYVALVNHAADFTLMPPHGGEIVHGFENTEANIVEMEQFFKSGEATLEVTATHASGNLAVLAVVERQHGVIGDYADQDLSLRVTLVFRREGHEWQLVHRHADPLVHRITYDQITALLRGASTE
jgi:ketosteroid isomerase-like protein